MGRSIQIKKSFFITGTDTDVGKTVATVALGQALQKEGFFVGAFKPVQCGGQDAVFLKKHLKLDDPLENINPYFAPDPLSPHIAFKRAGITIHKMKILRKLHQLQEKYDIVLIEGAGGLMAPVTNTYLMRDLIRDIDVPVIIVARTGLGTINHTLLTLSQAHCDGLDVRGIVLNQHVRKTGVAEQTNPRAVQHFGRTRIIGELPFYETENRFSADIDTSFLKEKRRKRKTKKLQQWDKQYVWHPFTQMKDWLQNEPLVIDEAKDNYLKDSDGKSYFDGVSSLWVNVHGHRHPIIDAAVRTQLNKVSHSTLLGLSNTPSIELAKELVDITPKGLDKVFYSDNGSTSVEIAVKMAYQYWQNVGQTKKTDIAHMANSYHGDTLGSVSVGGISLFHRVYRDLIFKTIQINFPDCYRAPKGQTYPDYAFACLDRFEKKLKAKHHTIAALVVEPLVQGAAGMIVWPKGILKRMETLCRTYDIFLIADEVATGFGRTGKMFACEHEGVRPDFMCLAKGLTGGYLPLAVTLTSQKIYDGFSFPYTDQKTFFHGHTYTGNPLACAAALANLQVFDKEKVMNKVQSKIKSLRNALKMFYNLDSVGDVRQLGLMVGIELVADRKTKKPYPWERQIGVRVCEAVRAKGLILRPLGNVIVFMPPLSITSDQIQWMCDVTYQAIEDVTGK